MTQIITMLLIRTRVGSGLLKGNRFRVLTHGPLCGATVIQMTVALDDGKETQVPATSDVTVWHGPFYTIHFHWFGHRAATADVNKD